MPPTNTQHKAYAVILELTTNSGKVRVATLTEFANSDPDKYGTLSWGDLVHAAKSEVDALIHSYTDKDTVPDHFRGEEVADGWDWPAHTSATPLRKI